MPVSKLCRTLDELSREIDNLSLDAIILGSDALFDYTPIRARRGFNFRKLKFNPPTQVSSNHDLPNPFWGSFNDMIKNKIPYCGFSISSQNAPFYLCNKYERKELKRLINNFRAITTRDEWTMSYISEIGGRNDIYVTPDPVFAFNYNTDFNVSKQELLEKYGLPENYILVSFCKNILSDDFVNSIINKVEEKLGYPVVSFPMPRRLRKFNTRFSIDLPLPTLDWYFLIKYSRGYIGELMHPIIVCLHNNVPFFCFDQYGTRKRIIPYLYYKYMPESSKIFDILQKADLLNNVHPYNGCKNTTPEEVAQAFLTFDTHKCGMFAEAQHARYEEGMNYVLKSLVVK